MTGVPRPVYHRGVEQFVDLRYLGIELGRRLRLSEVGPETAYVEAPTPMPVGSELEIEAGGVTARAVVLRVQEQVAGAERPPGMRVRAVELSGAARDWWQGLVSAEDPVIPEAAPEPAAEAAGEPAAEEVAHRGEAGEVVDDGKKTEIMQAVEPPAEAAEPPAEPEPAKAAEPAEAEPEPAKAAKAAKPAEAAASDEGDDGGKKRRRRRGGRRRKKS